MNWSLMPVAVNMQSYIHVYPLSFHYIQEPNAAHKAIAELEARLKPQERKVTVVTQNIDRLHHRAGSQNVIELHGEGCGLACRLVPRPSPMRCSHLSICRKVKCVYNGHHGT